MVELADTLDLGAVTSVKVFCPAVIANQSADWCGNPFSKSRFTCFYKSWIRRYAPPRIPLRVKIRGTKEYAGMVELVDSGDLGTVTLEKVFYSAPLTLLKAGLPVFIYRGSSKTLHLGCLPV